MQVLGIYDGTHDAGVALLRDGDLVAACNEERFSRVKGAGGWPTESIAHCLRAAGGAVDRVAFAGVVNPNPGLRGVRRLQRSFRLDDGAFYVEDPTPGDRIGQWLQFRSPFPYLRAEHPASALIRPAVRGMLQQAARRSGIAAPVSLHEHHRCHAASAWYTSGFREGLVVVADGIGDGLALTVWRGGEAGLTRLGAMPYPHSYGLLYATITGFLGFRPFRHEGKLTGLAALGDPAAVREPFPFHGPVEDRRFTQRFGAELRPWLDRLRGYRREDVCAWLQAGLERELGALCAWWMAREGLSRLALAGGVFGNVRLNQAIAALPGVEALSVHPHMGDGGLAAGAALCAWAEADPAARPRAMRHAFLGPAWGEEEIRAALLAEGLAEGAQREGQREGVVRRPQDLEEQVAQLLAEGRIVARFDGAMEYGPRALGNRSILASAADPRMTDRLNLALSRSDFMPFAPLLLDEVAEAWVEGLSPVREAARFMTVTVQATARMRKTCPAAIHVDGSLRPQLVDAATHPGLHRILSGYYRRTGVPALINTSYNLHEEPIVCRPQEAIATWRAARIDALAIGPFLVGRA